METTVLVNVERLAALMIVRTFVIGEDGQRHWREESCAYKFVVADGQLVIGPINSHVCLYAAFRTWDDPIEVAKPKIDQIEEQSYMWRSTVTAAGEVGPDGRVTGWKSIGFKIETPVHMREDIAQLIGLFYVAGALAI